MNPRGWPKTELEWIRFRNRYSVIVAKVARASGITKIEDVEDVQGIFWMVVFTSGIQKDYDPRKGTIEAFLVALAKTIARNVNTSLRRGQARIEHLIENDLGHSAWTWEHAARTSVSAMDECEFAMLIEQAGVAVTNKGNAMQRRVWDALLAGDTRREIQQQHGVSKSYVSVLVGRLRCLPEVAALREG